MPVIAASTPPFSPSGMGRCGSTIQYEFAGISALCRAARTKKSRNLSAAKQIKMVAGTRNRLNLLLNASCGILVGSTPRIQTGGP
jgi:hypothetical protein